MTDLIITRPTGPHPIFVNLEVIESVEDSIRDRARRLGFGPDDSFMVILKHNARNHQEPTVEDLFIDEALLPPGNGTPHMDALLQHAEDYERVTVGSPGLNITIKTLRNELQRMRHATEGLQLCQGCHRLREILRPMRIGNDTSNLCLRCSGDEA